MATSKSSLRRVVPLLEPRSARVINWPIRAERRLKARYPLDLSVNYRYVYHGFRFSGAGRAVDLSSGGILVASHHQLIEYPLMELSIEWPFLLDGRVPLQLITIGRALPRGEFHFAVAFERHEFRTTKSSGLRRDEYGALSNDGPPSLTPPPPTP